MKILKLLFTILVIILANNSSAQEYYLIGGINISKLSQYKNTSGYNESRTIQPGLQIGTGMDLKFNNYLSFMPQVLFSLKREKIISELKIPFSNDGSHIISNLKTKSQLKDFCLDIPLNLKLKYSFNKIDVFTFAGPYVSLLLFDNSTHESSLNDEPIEPESFDEKFINRLDYGLNFGIGINTSSYLIYISCDSGLYREKKYEEVVMKNKFRNSIFKISLGYKF